MSTRTSKFGKLALSIFTASTLSLFLLVSVQTEHANAATCITKAMKSRTKLNRLIAPKGETKLETEKRLVDLGFISCDKDGNEIQSIAGSGDGPGCSWPCIFYADPVCGCLKTNDKPKLQTQ